MAAAAAAVATAAGGVGAAPAAAGAGAGATHTPVDRRTVEEMVHPPSPAGDGAGPAAPPGDRCRVDAVVHMPAAPPLGVAGGGSAATASGTDADGMVSASPLAAAPSAAGTASGMGGTSTVDGAAPSIGTAAVGGCAQRGVPSWSAVDSRTGLRPVGAGADGVEAKASAAWRGRRFGVGDDLTEQRGTGKARESGVLRLTAGS